MAPSRNRSSLLGAIAGAAAAGLAVVSMQSSNPPATTAFGTPPVGDPLPGTPAAIARVKALLPKVDAAFFDIDSTVVRTEGIDLLGGCFGVMEEIAALTHKAMNGNVKFQDAMADRLQLMADNGMTKDSLEKCVEKEGAPQWSPGVKDLVKMLHKQGTDVYLVSGGFVNMIRPVALELHVPFKNIYANIVQFDKNGNYTGFDRHAPTSASGGKPRVLEMMQKKHFYKTMIMFGDGATDMDARTEGPADAFIGYGGIVARPKIEKGADWFIRNFSEALDCLPSGTDL